MNDSRFRRVATDPRFKSVPRRQRRVKIDSRFKHMFSDGRFKVQYDVDKRGRKVKHTSTEDLRKYYQLDDEGSKGGDGEVPADSEGETPCDSERVPVDNEGEVPDDKERAVASDNEGDVPGDEESSESSDEVELIDDEVLHNWGGGGDVMVGDGVSHRLALCNMDWERISAQDVYVLVNSFKPSGGLVVSVRVYPSDFGLERMAKEDIEGPAHLLSGGPEEVEEGSGYSQEKLRQYQLNRLKYYYAVIECDSVGTAEHIYQECDGLEYEHSGGQLDLRFIPDEVTFDDREAKSVATETTVPVNFNPATFVSAACQQSKVRLTWDETDPHRLKTTMRKLCKDDAAQLDYSAYLASDSDDSYNGDKYKALLSGEEGSKGQLKPEEDMEITWEPGLKETAEKLVKKRSRKSLGEGLTQWDKYLQERKRKRKEKKLAKKEEFLNEDVSGFDDDFFNHNVTMATVKQPRNKRQHKGQPKDDTSELELLMMDGQDKEHFNYSDIVRRNSDNFEMDVMDPRFVALYESPQYAPDPAHPQFKNTKAMEALMKEKMKRRQKKARTESSKDTRHELEPLVSEVKRKTTTFKQRRHRRSKPNT